MNATFKCKRCSGDVVCTTKVAGPTAKNPGKQYWACSKCSGWCGWVGSPAPTPVPSSPIKTAPSSPAVLSPAKLPSSPHFMAPFCPVCTPLCRTVVAESMSESNHGRKYFHCGQCNKFVEWCDSVAALSRKLGVGPSGPPCKCIPPHASIQVGPSMQDNANRGRYFWKCAAKACNFFEWVEGPIADLPVSVASPATPKTAVPRNLFAEPRYKPYVQPQEVKLAMQRLFNVESTDAEQLMKSRDMRERTLGTDFLEVQAVWQIENPVSRQRYLEFKQGLMPVLPEKRVQMREEHRLSVERLVEVKSSEYQLQGMSFEPEKNEIFMLHGTSAECVDSILFEGMDLSRAGEGLFGKGIYGAEHPAKSKPICHARFKMGQG